jgi:EF-P beta-lysylation protein EpmB
MIATSSSWQQQLATAISNPAELWRELQLDPALLPQAIAAAQRFPLRIPASYLSRMRRGDPNDPLLLQVLPLGAELHSVANYSADPVGDREAIVAPGLLQKYHGRALLITTQACAIHCRYCFRREFPYAEQQDAAPRWHSALQHIASDSSLEEIILSGGDPLSLHDARLQQLTDALSQIPHIKRLRIHTRLPIVLPDRIDSEHLAWLRSLPWPIVVVLHTNHANEIDAEVQRACRQLRDAGVVLLNQTVLLRAINDNVPVLRALSETLFDAGIMPYYLHTLDPVQGAAHFDIDISRAQQLIGALAAQLPGYLVPRLVQERAGASAKVTLTPDLP